MPEVATQHPDEHNVPETAPRRPSRPAVFFIAMGALVGFLMAWVAYESSWSITPDLPPLYDEVLVKQVYSDTSRSVVEITTTVRSGIRVGSGAGSGFFVDREGHIVTNNHVVENATSIQVRLYDNRVIPAEKLGFSPDDDLALLKVDPELVKDITPLTLADSSQISPGQMAIAIGSPFENFNSVSVGVVSGVNRSRLSNPQDPSSRRIPNLLQTDAALNPGNSGGPLLNSEGQVIGVNSSVQVQNGVQIGVGFAVPSNTVSGIVNDLVAPGEFRRVWLGFKGWDVAELRDGRMTLASDTGIYVREVCPNSPGSEAGLRGDEQAIALIGQASGRGDIIVRVDDTPITSFDVLLVYLNDKRAGDSIDLHILRNSRPMTVSATLAPWRECA